MQVFIVVMLFMLSIKTSNYDENSQTCQEKMKNYNNINTLEEDSL